MPKDRVTIQDVARAAGVSAQTVSRVLNNRPDVSSETRSRIQEIIKTLDYAPNTIARSLSRGRTNTIGVVGFGLEYFGSSSVLIGIERKANELGYSILLTLFEQFGGGDADDVLLQMAAQQVAGIIWSIPGFLDSPKLNRPAVKNLSVPIIHLNRRPSKSSPVVSVNNRLGGRLATEHLLDQGFQKVGIITGPRYWWEAEERFLGWKQVMQERGVSDLDDLVFEGNWEAESGDRGFQTLITKNANLEAIFVSNDQMALGVIQAANRIGIQIPGDLSIVGFDDIPESEYFLPPLTTVRQDAKRLGALAVTSLHAFIEDSTARQKIIESEPQIIPELVVRQSSRRAY